ncbi:MAG: CHAT domain-containing protein [Syntrophobacteraceae bacterium]
MNYLRDLALNSFVLIRAGLTVETALQLLDRFPAATHVIVYRTEPDVYLYLREEPGATVTEPVPPKEVKEYYYLYTVPEAREGFEQAAHGESVRYALNLREHTATMVSDAYSDAAAAPTRGIVMDEGRLVGFFDANVPPPRLTRSSKLRGVETSEPVPRSLKADFAMQVQLQQTVSLLVTLSPEIAAVGAVTLPVAVKVGTTLDVIVQPRRGFTIAGNGEASLVVSDEEETVQFKLTAIDLGPGEVRVLAFQGGQRLGTIILKPLVVTAAQPVSADRVTQEHDIVSLTGYEPDLYLLIFQSGSKGGPPEYTFRLKSRDPGLGLQFKKFGPVILNRDPEAYFNYFFEGIEGLQLNTANDKAVAQKKLEAKGTELFQKMIPPDLQVLLWSLKDRIKSVEVESEEPWIPWELCRLQGKQDGRIIYGPFFCEAFSMTRWLQEIEVKPTLGLKKMALVIPKDSGLPFAKSERDYLLSLATGGRQVERIPATFLEIKAALGRGEYDGWHFTGHGGFRPVPNNSVMLLENGEVMTPTDLSDSTNLGLARPLVFLNACQIGRSAMSLTDIGGWAKGFLEAGAGAFIGAYWSIYDQAANDFAQAFYSNFLAGMEIGQAVQAARQKIKPLGDPTWLAYTVYANPLAKVA